MLQQQLEVNSWSCILWGEHTDNGYGDICRPELKKNALGGDLVWEGLWPTRKGTEGCTVDSKS